MNLRRNQIAIGLLLLATLLLTLNGSASSRLAAVQDGPKQPLARAEQNILQYRQGNAIIKAQDRDGTPLTGVRLKITQLSHDFKFGCYLSLEELDPAHQELYQRQFRSLFNYATLGFYWTVLEWERGDPNWERWDREAAWALSQGIGLKGHPLVWGADAGGTPAWLPRNKQELNAIVKQHIQETMTRYQGKVKTWDVVNEPLEGGIFEDVLGKDYVKAAFQWAREADPQAQLSINENTILGAWPVNREPYLQLLSSLLAEGTPIDIIGIQAHESIREWLDPAVVTATLDRYAALGKPIHITEVTVQGGSEPITGGYRNGVWDPEQQAQYYREFFTVCFGHPQVEALTVWGLDDARVWIENCGLLDQRWQPKPAYLALDQLIDHQWHTELAGIANNGIYRLRGFYGDYLVEADLPGGPKVKQKFTLRRGAANEWTIRSLGIK